MAECGIQNGARRGGQISALGALLVGLAIIAGAAGDHLVAGQVSRQSLHVYDIAVRFQIYNALGLVLLGILIRLWGKRRLLCASALLMALGVFFFCGGLYLLVITGQSFWAIFAPLGGTAWIVAWLLLAVGLWRASMQVKE
ncbi:hypothetical protein A6M27_01295 [Acidithiobacillus thiooxidans]|uniref:DUF423 domain-containing protein n=1 Tax=Acidithiobacillus thiooxidans TaxID=930 RepID=A0A1C2IT16_ACITH|nr:MULTISPECIES: DUF423 domain-containing protein [Acidithiobacillus]MDD5278162.1 DUF423 domain-containing protein [Acidithiobacillus sp.]OCX68292.1 hypothetical protein A6M23_18640 [Acidithiobacillus thiooxidans]OCX69815.1 hypothetical protein A6P07_15705 [Acidithiobacillus thiooxidans]OCX70418.1 hypothetical protein A6O24_16490 [Acidithiobacillus thiooxidans]OCX79139.1 hypothetical protein A6O26_17160 [Acidithiobacillus thiooxidans]